MCIGQEAVIDLELALLAVAVVPEGGQWAGDALEVTRAQVVERQCIVVEVACRELALDAVLAFEQPVEGFVEVVLIGISHPEDVGQGGDVPPARSRELAVGLEDARDHHCHHEVACP